MYVRTECTDLRLFSLFKGAGVTKMEEIVDPISVDAYGTIGRRSRFHGLRMVVNDVVFVIGRLPLLLFR